VSGYSTEQALLVFTDCKRAYQLTYGTEAGRTVLADMAKLCRANENAAVPGDRDRTWALIGRREVYLYIRDYLDLTPEQLVEKYTRPATGAISHDDRTALAE
jgi:hypothetical protein